VSETKGWLLKATDDLRAAEHGRNASPPLLADILFHCQQAVEKTLKAYLVWNNQIFRKTHTIEELGESCLHINPGFRNLIDRAAPLTQDALAV
jgi:HEPN domain-containing protein